MATIYQGILGPFSGKVGTVVGAMWKGIATIRAYNPHVNNPNSPAQLEQRAKFALMGSFLRPFVSLFKITYASQANKQTASNAALQYNLKNAISGAYPNYTVNYTKVLLGEGPLPVALNAAADSSEANKIDFTWADNSYMQGADVTDKVVLSVYSPEFKKSVSIIAPDAVTRASGSYTMTLPAIFSGEEVQTYIGFVNSKVSVSSNIEFLAAVIVA